MDDLVENIDSCVLFLAFVPRVIKDPLFVQLEHSFCIGTLMLVLQSKSMTELVKDMSTMFFK